MLQRWVAFASTRRGAIAAFAWLPLILTVGLWLVFARHGQLGWDFRNEYWLSGWRFLHGGNVYSWSKASLDSGTGYPYPAPATLLFAVPAFLSGPLATNFAVLACMACPAVALAVLSVRDWRVYGLVMMWSPVIAGWQTANLTLPLLVCLACGWRWRDRPILVGACVAVVVLLKPAFWPIIAWLILARRWRSAGWAAGAIVAGSVVAWTITGWSTVGAFLHLDARLTAAHEADSYGIPSLVLHATDVGHLAATAVMICVGIGFALLTWRARNGDERILFSASLLLMLLASPLVDNHYFALLILPLALLRPMLVPIWLAPLALWLCPNWDRHGWESALAWTVVGGLAWVLASSRQPRQIALTSDGPGHAEPFPPSAAVIPDPVIDPLG